MICKICQQNVTTKGSRIEGYQQNRYYLIFECDNCKTSFVNPPDSDSQIYQSIYKYSSKIKGYNRYEYYANTIKSKKHPLIWLSEEEEVYYAVKVALADIQPGSIVIEIGSGLGYTTYAIRNLGYNAFGFDLSSSAIDSAKLRFGNFYFNSDIFSTNNEIPLNSAKLIILTEVIEHLEDPCGFLQKIKNNISDGTRIIVTTPNKTCHKKGCTWGTELPPVHLYWFTSQGLRTMCESLGYKCNSISFSEYSQKRIRRKSINNPIGRPILDSKYEVIRSHKYSIIDRIKRYIKSNPIANFIYKHVWNTKTSNETDEGVFIGIVLEK